MNKNAFALTPPMGWNSYDYYDTTVNEEQVKSNAAFMASNMKAYGWEYIVVDIEWYSHNAGSKRDLYQYIPFWGVEMDAYSRLLPDPARFPSSEGGKGFAPLADYIHSLGLKFGIHIMRGIPRTAAHNHTAILGSAAKACDVADPSNICDWNPDMYGLRPQHPASQIYYNSVFDLYAQWGVDFVKCDDICRMDMASAKKEIEMLHHAIAQCGRSIVLSLSPGPALIDEAWHYETYANMWRITDDFWDDWKLLKNMFYRCEVWQNHVSFGCFPDCDMLPIGSLGKGFGSEHLTNFTKEEQLTMMTLWCIFRSPLMIGSELTKLDDWTLSYLTNPEVLKLLSSSCRGQQLQRSENSAVWYSKDSSTNESYFAFFNLQDSESVIPVCPQVTEYLYALSSEHCKEIWSGTSYHRNELKDVVLPAHGVKLFHFGMHM